MPIGTMALMAIATGTAPFVSLGDKSTLRQRCKWSVSWSFILELDYADSSQSANPLTEPYGWPRREPGRASRMRGFAARNGRKSTPACWRVCGRCRRDYCSDPTPTKSCMRESLQKHEH